ncbi:MAG: hypothetical protein Q9182_000607 [Xanthomendoza sp. 2 TL-2023]
MASNITRVRSLYRAILRELPQRPLSTPSPVQQRIRNAIAIHPQEDARSQMEQAEQYIQYAKAQRMYTALLERCTPAERQSKDNRKALQHSAGTVTATLRGRSNVAQASQPTSFRTAINDAAESDSSSFGSFRGFFNGHSNLNEIEHKPPRSGLRYNIKAIALR